MENKLTLTCFLTCSFIIMGIGRASMTRSVTMFARLPKAKCRKMLTHLPGPMGFQACSRGLHWKAVEKILAIMFATMIAANTQQVFFAHFAVKIRRYSARIEGFGKVVAKE